MISTELATLFMELRKCEYTDTDIQSCIYNGVSFKQGVEEYEMRLNNLYNERKYEISCLSAGELKYIKEDLSSITYDVPLKGYINGMERDLCNSTHNNSLLEQFQIATFLFSMSQVQNNIREDIIKSICILLGEDKEQSQQDITEIVMSEEQNSSNNLYTILQDKYGAIMTVQNICDFFHITPRTVTNWEKKGYLSNISNQSGDTNANGHRKRGDEKRYMTKDIAYETELKKKYNKL